MQITLKAWIRKNHLTEDPNDFAASVISSGSATTADIVKALVKEGMEIKPETAIDIITRFNRKASELVLSGFNVNTGLVYMRPVIKGAFYDKNWSSATNPVYIAMNQGSDLRMAVSETVVQILGEQNDPMSIFTITNTTTGNTEGVLTAGRNVEIKGSFIKVTGELPECGVEFKNVATGDIVKLALADYVLNEPSRLLLMIPADMPKGEYELTITTQFSNNKVNLKTARSASANMPIFIE